MKKLLLGAMALVSFYANAQLPVEHFDADWTGSPAAPPGWIVINEFGPTQTWKQTTPGNVNEPPYGATGHAAYLNKENVGSAGTASDWLISPVFQMQTNLQIRFQSKLTIAGDQGSVYKVYIMPDFLAPTIANFTSNGDYLIASYTELEINPVQTDWVEKVINVPANPSWPAGNLMRIALVMQGNDGDRWFIDDFGIANACLAPTNLTANVSGTAATLGWTESADATTWEVEVLNAGGIPSGVGSTVTANSGVVVISTSLGTPFTPYDNYKYYVRSACSDGGKSEWAGPRYFPYENCPAPTGIVISAANLTSITYVWNPSDAVSYDYYITVSDVPPSATTISTGTSPTDTVTITNLTPGLDYKFYVRAHCADGGISPWSGFPEIITPVDNNIFTGKVTYDTDGDGLCNDSTAGIPYVEVQVSVNGAAPFSVFTNEAGEYKLYSIEDGVTNLTLQVVAPAIFAPAAPLVQAVTFSDTIDALGVTHCLAQPSVSNDLSVVIIPISVARPGLPATYRIIAHNAGSTSLENVVLNVSFNDDRIDYFSSEYANTTATIGNVSINLGTMQPFSVHNGDITFQVATPPVNTGGENLSFTATISDIDDISPDDNTALLNQIIVNSYDPNDITVHEGAEIYEEQADDYLTYTIRFQNTGTADAIDIKLTNTLDELLDWETFKPVVSSHNYTVKRTDDLLEFEYKNIHLADNTSNEAASHGYITYKIKPKAGFGVGDIVSNTAQIYFDFNEAIVTNTATTTVVALAGLKGNAMAIARLYPNPVKGELHVEVAQGDLQSVTIYDVNGRLCLSANAGVVDTNALKSGIYFVKVTTDAGSANYKIIKQ